MQTRRSWAYLVLGCAWCLAACEGSSSGAGGPDAGAAASADAGAMEGAADAGPADEGDAGSDPRFEATITYVTANVGRNYGARAEMTAALEDIRSVVGARSGPKFIGWQEIGEGDPCGNCEAEEILARYSEERRWATRRPRGERPDGGSELVKVPITWKTADADASVRAVFASPGWAGVSPTRFVTVLHEASRNVSLINTHFIAGAWSCKSNVQMRRDYWRRAWTTLKDEVAKEHERGRNVIVTGDLNRPRQANDCNPAWDPASLHARARVIGGRGIDYIYAVPAAGQRFVLARRSDDSVQRGAIELGIDSHAAHWVAGQFLPE